MKLKRGIKLLICCLATMSILSINGLITEAALCKHPIYQVAENVLKEKYHDEYRHYIVYGTQYTCSACGYTYWENLGVTRENHKFVTKTEVINGKPAEIIYCSECGFLPS